MPRAQLLYDGACAFCCRSIALTRRLDWLGRLEYVDVRQDSASLHHPALHQAKLLDQMHVLTPAGEVRGGYDAVRWIAWRLPLLWPVAPLLALPGITQLGDRTYRWVARNRFQLVPCDEGTCVLPPRPAHLGDTGPKPYTKS